MALFAIMSLTNNTAYCMSVNLTVDQINKAIKYGHTNKRTSPKDFAAPWIVRLDEKSGWATLWTPYHNVAFKAKKAAVERRETISKRNIKGITYQGKLDFCCIGFR